MISFSWYLSWGFGAPEKKLKDKKLTELWQKQIFWAHAGKNKKIKKILSSEIILAHWMIKKEKEHDIKMERGEEEEKGKGEITREERKGGERGERRAERKSRQKRRPFTKYRFISFWRSLFQELSCFRFPVCTQQNRCKQSFSSWALSICSFLCVSTPLLVTSAFLSSGTSETILIIYLQTYGFTTGLQHFCLFVLGSP